MAGQGPIARLLAGQDAAAAEVLASEADGLPAPSRGQVRPLMRLAAAGEAPGPRAARWLLTAWRLRDAAATGRLLAVLPGLPAPVREAAGGWLFWPEAGDELALRRQLLDQAETLLALAQARPQPWLYDGLAEVLGQRGGRPLRRLLELTKAYDWARQVAALLPAELRLPGGWSPDLWLAWQQAGSARVRRLRRPARAGDWDSLAGLPHHEQALARRFAGDSPKAAAASALAWPAGPRSLEVLQEVARITAAEGLAAWRAAQAVAREQGRPVLLLGNASLGGPPLWAAPGPWQQRAALPTDGLTAPPAAEVRGLARLRAQRLGGGHLLRCLWELCAAAILARRGRGHLAALTAAARPWLSPEQLEALRQGSLGLALGGLPLAPALKRTQDALARCRALEAQARRAIQTVYGLAAAGRGPLVLPWADKFAASTAKAGDHLYLAWLTELFSRLSPPPLLVLVDETTHPEFPSLARVLAAARRARPGLVFRGLGAFAGRPQPTDLTAALGQAARGAHLV
ncbi:MAG: hypothetical protein AB1814_05510, partial [Thermodesulfobacteriota bacterium]